MAIMNKPMKVEVELDQRSRRLMERMTKALEDKQNLDVVVKRWDSNNQPKLPTPRMQQAHESLICIDESEKNIELYLRIVEAFGELDEDEEIALWNIHALCSGHPLTSKE